jgi:hypothetical protein
MSALRTRFDANELRANLLLHRGHTGFGDSVIVFDA